MSAAQTPGGPVDFQDAPPLTRMVAEFAHGTPFEALPGEVVRAAADHLLDALGVGLAAASLPGAAGLRQAVASLGAGPESTALGLAGPLPAASAALLNGALMHSLEYDDTHIASVVHGSAAIVPAVLAVAEREGRTGADLLRAMVMGWELLVRLGLAAPGRFQQYGFQITAVGGPFAGALAGALLSGLTAAQTVSAMGIAGSQASGVFEFLQEGATVKSLHPGWAAHSGVVAAALAAGGMTGPATIFEGRFGLYATHARLDAPPPALRGLMEELGRRWFLPEASLKAYPCCHYIHPFLECLESVLDSGVAADSIEAVHCGVSEGMLSIICEPWERKLKPASGYDAKFSLPYCLTALLADDALNVSAFAGETLPPATLALTGMVTCESLSGTGFPERFPARLTARLRSGETITREVPNVRGAPDRPLSPEEIRAKFRENAVRVLRPAAVERVVDLVEALPTAQSLAPLGAALREVI